MKLLAQCLRSRESHLYSCINDLQGSHFDPACCLYLVLDLYPFCVYDTLRTCQVGGTNNITYVMSLSLRNPDLDYVNPEKEVYIGLWCLQAGATLFLSARLWAKLTRRHGLWWDDYILLTTWVRRLERITKEVAH